jgi:hypothetical protein
LCIQATARLNIPPYPEAEEEINATQ